MNVILLARKKRISNSEKLSMKIIFSVAFTTILASAAHAAYVPGEYNVWRSSDGVLYATTQTENYDPVLVSILGPGTDWSSIVISFISKQHCDADKKSEEVKINMGLEKLDFHCQAVGDDSIITYTVSKPKKANELYSKLKSGFTVVIDNRINIWSANIREPK